MHLKSHLTKKYISQYSSLLNITDLWEPNLTVCFEAVYSQPFFASLPFQTSDDLMKRWFKTGVLQLRFLPALWQSWWFGELRIFYFTGIPFYIPRTWDQINQIWPEGVGDDTVQERKVKPHLDLLIRHMRILLFVNNSWICCVMKKTL